MPMELLRQLAQRPLPFDLYEPADIDKLAVLRAAELVSAVIPPSQQLATGERLYKPATVLAITERGQKALKGLLESSAL